MEVQRNRRTVEETLAAIRALDLEPIKFKLMDREEGQGWSREYVEMMEVAYKRFLSLLVSHPEATIAPSKDIDKFWHGHILDTMKYAEDCERVFGYFLHHFPYFGMRGDQDAAQLQQAGESMARLYEQEFGEPMPAGGQAAAFCFAAQPKTDAAFCFAAQPAADAAFCFAARADASFCFASKPVARHVEAAFCFAARPKADATFCFAARPETDAAFCFASRPKADAAFCFAAKGAAPVDIATRPTLALAA